MSFQSFAEMYMIPAQLVLAMFGMGATLRVQDFVEVVRDAKGLLIGLALQLLFVPIFAVSFIEVFDLGKGWAVGLVLVAVVPGGAFSNLLTYLGRGNAALSVSLTTVSNVACIVTIPGLLHVLVSEYMPPEFEVPTRRIITDIFLYLLMPLAVGMVVLRADERKANAASRWAIRGSVALLLVIVVSSLGSGRIDLPAYGWGPPLLIILFGNLLWFVAAQLCRLFGRYDDDTMALTIEVSVRNMAVALLLVRFFFEGKPEQEHVLYTCLFYAGMSFFIGIPMVISHRAGRSPASFRAPHPRPAPRAALADASVDAR